MDFPNFEYQEVVGSLLRTADRVKIYWEFEWAGACPPQKMDSAVPEAIAVMNRERQLEAENEKLKAKIGDLVMQMEHLKKLQAWAQQRKKADTSIITAKNWDQFRKPAK
jgi:hypothetical protein